MTNFFSIAKRATKRFIVMVCAMLFLVVMVVLALFIIPNEAQADQFDDQINALKDEITTYESRADELRKKADTLQNQISQLELQQEQVQTQIDLSTAEYKKLQSQIKDTEVRIQLTRDLLGETIADLYIEEAISPLEMLASSRSIADYVDRQTFLYSIRDSLSARIAKIRELKEQLETSRDEVKEVLDRQIAQRNSLAAARARQIEILADTQGKEDQYRQLVARTIASLDAASARQRSYFESISTDGNGGASGVVGEFEYWNWSGNKGCSGGYSYCSGGLDYTVDKWALYARECVSYLAWALENRFNRYVASFNGKGNAHQWPESAPEFSGAKRVTDPQPGDAVILPRSGDFAPIGHAMIVDSVDGDTLHVSQFNFYGSGEYSTMDIKNSGVILLRFQSR